MAERQLKDWLTTYLEWTLPRSESPRSLILWAGLFTLASAVRRRVSIPISVLGNRTYYPNLYIVFVGNPGVVRKSTTAGFAEELMVENPVINVAPSSTSASKLIDLMAQTKDGSITVLSSEFSSFIGTSKEDMYDLLTDLYDGKLKHDLATRARNLETIKTPCVNLLAATTPSWISKQPIEHLVSGGFASRTIFIFENSVRQRRFFYRNLNWRDFEEKGKMLRADLLRISKIKGEFSYDSSDTMDFIEAWYYENADSNEGDERTMGYYERRPTHAQKVSMLLSLSERDDKIITRAHFEAALLLLAEIEEKMPRALSAVGNNPITREIDAVLDFIRRNMVEPGVEARKVLSRFYQHIPKKTLDEILGTLVALGEIEEIKEGNGEGRRSLYRIPKRRKRHNIITMDETGHEEYKPLIVPGES